MGHLATERPYQFLENIIIATRLEREYHFGALVA